jgi:DNA-binding transcriptional MocR family regulator
MAVSYPEPHYARRAERMRASEIREYLKLIDRPGLISFAGGIPDPALFPAEAFAAAYARVLGDPATAKSALQYSISEGYLPLRQWIAERMTRDRGIPCTADNVMITAGSQQALDFIGKLMLSAGDTALVAAPTYLGALMAFNPYEPRYDALPMEASNRTPASYADASAAAAPGARVKLAYAVPDFANPTGETMPLEERRRLLALADELDCVVVEDTAYTERFSGDPQPSLASLDVADKGSVDASRVIHCGTFSKVLAPALRIGWVVAAAPIVRRLVLIKQAADLHSGTIDQVVMHQVAAETYDSQIAKVTASYRERRDAMLSALARHMPAGVHWSRPEGGMFVWASLPPGQDAGALVERAVAEQQVAYVPGRAFFTDGTGTECFRLSFTLPTPPQIEKGIGKLARVFAAA